METKLVIDAVDLGKTYRTLQQGQGFLSKLKSYAKPTYRECQAIIGLDLKVHSGEMLGFIGENGSGKSTTIKLLSGILKPTAGSLTVCNLRPFEDRRKYVGGITAIMGQKSQLWWDVPVRDSFEVLRAIYKIPGETYDSNVRRFTEALDIGPLLDKAPRTLSLGQRVRCDFAAGLLHDPVIAFLDEPTIGLDLKVKDLVRKFLAELNRSRGMTVFLTSHDVDDIEELCDRVVVLDQGRKRYDAPMVDFLGVLGGVRKVDFESDSKVTGADFSFGRLLQVGEGKFSLIFDPTKVQLSEIYGQLAKIPLNAEVKVNDVDVKTVLRHMEFSA